MIELKPTDKVTYELHIHQIDYNKERENALKKRISEKYGIPLKNVNIDFKPITVNSDGKEVSLTSEIIDNIQDPQFQVRLMEETIKSREMKDVDFNEIKAIDSQVNAHVDFDQYAKYKRYRFKYVKWSNYLSYGEDNYFDFTKLHGLVLLNSEPGNQGGKTTFAINLLRFALFGKAEKSPNLNDVFNRFRPEATEVKVEACLEIDGCDYVIRRTITRPALKKRTDKSKPKQTVEYFKLVNGEYDLIDNCEGESAQQTNNIIRETVGNPEDYDLVISATKKTLDNLFDKGQTEKGRLFSRWLGLLSIEKKEEVAKDIWKKQISPTLLSNTYDRATVSSEIADFETCNKENEESIMSHESELKNVEKELEKLSEEKVEVLKSRRDINAELVKVDITTVENQIESKKRDLVNKRGQMAAKKEEYTKVKDAIFDLDKYNEYKKTVKSKEEEKHQYEIKNAELKSEIGAIRSDNERIRTLLSQGTCPNCGQPVDEKLQNGNIEKNELEINRLITNGKANKVRIDKISNEINKFEDEIRQMEVEREKVNEINRLKPTMVAIKANIDTIKLEIEKLERQKSDIENNKENIKYNNDIDNKIRIIDASIIETTKVKDQHIRDIQSCKNNIEYNNSKISDRKQIVKKLIEEEKIIRNWTVYQELVGKNGIIKVVLKQALPIINNEIHRILDGICDFDVVMEIDEKNDVCINLVCDGCSMPIEKASSGFEATFAGLAVRSALASISSLSKSSFMCLDEVDSTVNAENFEALHELYKRMLINYDFILHVEHNEDLQEMHDMTVTVVKENHISRIKVSE